METEVQGALMTNILMWLSIKNEIQFRAKDAPMKRSAIDLWRENFCLQHQLFQWYTPIDILCPSTTSAYDNEDKLTSQIYARLFDPTLSDK